MMIPRRRWTTEFVQKFELRIVSTALRDSARSARSNGVPIVPKGELFLLTIDRHRHVDGHDYMYALSEILDNAKECIFILVRALPLSLSFAF